MSVVNSIGNFLGNPFSASITSIQRCNLLGLNGASSLLMPNSPGDEIIPISSGFFGIINKAVEISSLALFFAKFIPTPVTAVIFAASVASCSIKVVNYGKNFIGSALSLDIGGVFTNGLATAGAAIGALPVGKLFSQGLSATGDGIKAIATKLGGGFRGYTVGASDYLYGRRVGLGMHKLLFSKGAASAAGGPGFIERIGQWFAGISAKFKAGMVTVTP